MQSRERCKFVAVPDVVRLRKDSSGVFAVGNARRTLEAFEIWRHQLTEWPLALVLQDGIEDLPIPWEHLAAVFVGGSTPFKTSETVKDIIRAAKIMEKWVHMGRVNGPNRFDACLDLGVDSIDGTGISRYTHMRKNLTEGMPLLETTA
jgi:hypothetical protein